VPIDRALTLRNAEKLIRQGKLDAGIAEYLRIVEDSPGDWNAKNTLGDLYARAGQTEKRSSSSPRLPITSATKAPAPRPARSTRRSSSSSPITNGRCMQVAEILANQKLYADARTHLNTLIELRKGKGDTRGALHAKSAPRIARPGRLRRASRIGPCPRRNGRQGRRFARSQGNRRGAGRRQGTPGPGDRRPSRSRTLNPDDDEVKEQLFDIYLAGGELLRAREHATTVEQFRSVASAFEAQGNTDEALETLRSAVALNDEDTELKAELARAFVAKGDLETAAQYLTVETAGDDPELLLTVADMRLRGEAESVEEGLSIARRLIEQDRARRDRVAQLGWTIAEHSPEAGFKAVELAADTASARTTGARPPPRSRNS
jgi:tetratricopeptide (TPR) repeat protein